MAVIVNRKIKITVDGIAYSIPAKPFNGFFIPDAELATSKELRAWDAYTSKYGHDVMPDSETSSLRI